MHETSNKKLKYLNQKMLRVFLGLFFWGFLVTIYGSFPIFNNRHL